MSAKTTAKLKGRKKSAALPIEADERHQDQVDDFIARNRDALKESIRRPRQEVEQGIVSVVTHFEKCVTTIVSARSINDIIADGRRRNKR